jgi:hypothetical protein
MFTPPQQRAARVVSDSFRIALDTAHNNTRDQAALRCIYTRPPSLAL